MAVYGFGALCGFASGIASRYYHLRPELTPAGLKTLPQSGFIGVALQVAAIAAAPQAQKFGSNKEEKDRWALFAYATTLVVGISTFPPLAPKFHFALPYKDLITTATLSFALFLAGVIIFDL